MSKSYYFFTDIDLLASQSSSENYGPAGTTTINGDSYDQFRVTSIHTATSDLNAYAVCDGIICVQEVTGNSNLVNIILKPTERHDDRGRSRMQKV